MFPENVLPVNAREQLFVVPLGTTAKLDPKLACDPVPLLVIALFSTLMFASTTFVKAHRMLPVIFP